jgi:hypothetical protein
MIKPASPHFKTAQTTQWTRERLELLGGPEMAQLLSNAERLGEAEVAALCREMLALRPARGTARSAREEKQAARLVPRSRAFSARGVFLVDPRTSWSGVRKSDGMVVMAIWHAAIVSRAGQCHCLLWAPNIDGARPWSDSMPGRERLEHCKLVGEGATAEGLLVHGESLPDRLPEDRARTIHGIDLNATVNFNVEKHGAEYWAAWGRRTQK